MPRPPVLKYRSPGQRHRARKSEEKLIFNNKNKQMHTDFIEREDTELGEQLSTHGEGMDTYGTILGFSAAEITEAKNDAKLWKYFLSLQDQNQAHGLSLSALKTLLRKGNGTQTLPATLPDPPANPTPLPTITAADIEGRFRIRANRAKAHPAYTEVIGKALRIVGASSTFDPNDGQPLIKIGFSVGGHPHLKIKKGGWQGVEYWKLVLKEHSTAPTVPGAPAVDPNDARFVKLERVFGADYVDPSELPSGGKSEIWVYKAIYLHKNAPVGMPSQLAVITVGGV